MTLTASQFPLFNPSLNRYLPTLTQNVLNGLSVCSGTLIFYSVRYDLYAQTLLGFS